MNKTTVCPKDVVVPVIFLPGIMGSRLQNASSDKVWDPDDALFMAITYAANSGTVYSLDPFRTKEEDNVRSAAALRKQLLIGGSQFNKSFLKPMEFSPHDAISSVSVGFWGSQVERNWGSVSQNSYGPILQALEGTFQDKLNELVQQSNPQFNLVEMPVFAIGYNWAQSNDDSGAYASAKIKEWVARAKQRAGELDAQCPGAIVVTHSMGGLVTRSAAKLHGAEGDIFAVLHTVMPTDGAAAAYKRFHFGFENPGAAFSKQSATEMAGYVVLGRQGALVTAILGHMPGGQELLPNKRYKDNRGQGKWLTIHQPKRNALGRMISGNTPFIELPNANPYSEIYQREDRMYRAANPDWLFPEGMDDSDPNASEFDAFVKTNAVAEAFHDALIGGGDFHEVTYLCFSADSSLRTYDRVDWRTDKWLGSLGASVDEDTVSTDRTEDYRREGLIFGEEGDKEISGGVFGTDMKIDEPTGAGDMTVPASAGNFVPGVPAARRTAHFSGYMHEPALKDPTVQSWVQEKMAEVLAECSLF